MKKLLATIVLSLSLTSCAEVADGLRDISQGTFLQKRIGNPFSYGNMPSYEFYEKFSETDNAQAVLPILEKNLITIENEKAFQFSSNLVNESTFSWFTPNDISSFNNRVDYSKELNKNKIKFISFYFSHILSLSKTNFYKVFNLNSNDVSITQLKQHCKSYRRILPLYKLAIKNGKTLYLMEDMGSGSAGSATTLSITRNLPTCKSLGYDKTLKVYGNEHFDN